MDPSSLQQNKLVNLQNWSKTISYNDSQPSLFPATLEELQSILKNPKYKHVKVHGTNHTFNTMGDTTRGGVFVCLNKMKQVTVEEHQVTFGAGVTYSELIKEVDFAGRALANLPSLPHINVVGSMVTATHGSGYNEPILAAHVISIKIAFADGTARRIDKRDNPENFYYYIINLGSVGIITEMTMKVIPQFKVFKTIYKDMLWDNFADDKNFDKLEQSCDFLSFFCDWDERKMSTVWCGNKYTNDSELANFGKTLFGAHHIQGQRVHPVKGRDSTPCVTVGAGSWREKIYHFLPDQPPSSDGEELHTEYFIAYKDFRKALEALYEIRHVFKHLVQVSECRMCCADEIPMSPAKGQPVITVHWTWYKQHDEVVKILPIIELVMNKFNAKPHFGKLFILSGKRFHQYYGEDLIKLKAIAKQHDPTGKFQNDFTRKYFDENDQDLPYVSDQSPKL